MSDENSTAVEYRDIPGFPGYRVGDDGSIWSCFQKAAPQLDSRGRCVGPRYVFGAWRELKPRFNRTGYRRAILFRDGQRHQVLVHKMVLLVFRGPCPPMLLGLHRDDDRTNNRLSNLYYGTYAQNHRDRMRNGRQVYLRGQDHGCAKLNDEKVREARRRREAGEPLARLAADYGVTVGRMWTVVTRRSWTHVE